MICVKTGAHIRLWNHLYAICDAFMLGDTHYLFQIAGVNVEPYDDVLHFKLNTYEMTFETVKQGSVVIVKAEDLLDYGYEGRPV